MIELKGIDVVFNEGTSLEHKALDGIGLRMEAGEFVTVIGGNGAGKSTLMNVLAGEVFPKSGSIVIDGQEVTRMETQRRAGWVSRVFQDPMLGSCADLSVEENMALAANRGERRGLGGALTKARRLEFKGLLADLSIGLEGRMGDPMGSLSGGQRQAVSLLMATMRPSKILLLDEHTAALDPKMARVVMGLSERLVRDYGLTTLMITHSMSQALEYGSRTLLMHHGKIERDLRGEERSGLKPSDLVELFDIG